MFSSENNFQKIKKKFRDNFESDDKQEFKKKKDKGKFRFVRQEKRKHESK
jgi:hypothetical protein